MLLLQDNFRNQLIQFELLLTTATFLAAIFGVVSGVFGMNFEVPLFKVPHSVLVDPRDSWGVRCRYLLLFLVVLQSEKILPLVAGVFISPTRWFFRRPPSSSHPVLCAEGSVLEFGYGNCTYLLFF
jgi:hypothetical protein